MPQPKFQLYKHCKIDGQWRYCRAAVFSNNKIKPHVVIVGGREEKNEEGTYCIRHKNSWIDAGTDPLEAQRLRSKLLDQVEYKDEKPAGAVRGTPLKDAAEKYFTNLENRGIKANSIRTYRNAGDPFITQCMKTKTCVEAVTKQDLLDFMGVFLVPTPRQLANRETDASALATA